MHALVLDAAEIEYLIGQHSGEFVLAVKDSDASRAKEELENYAAENRDWRVHRSMNDRHATAWPAVLTLALILLTVSWLEYEHFLGANWYEAGKMNAGLVQKGERWRTVTALTLHSSMEHLLANVAIGGLMVFLAGRVVGWGAVLLAILIGGTFGNFFNAWVRAPEQTSVGASTAVFAALGMVTAHGWSNRKVSGGFEKWIPLIGGALLLGFLGTGGERTDVGAHLLGFACGCIVLTLHERMSPSTAHSRIAQMLFAVAAFGLLSLAWFVALYKELQ